MKADKWTELSNLMHKSTSKVNDLKTKNKHDHREFRCNKKKLISENSKKVKHEKIRIDEETKLNQEMQSEYDKEMDEIEQLVYQDTTEQHQEKFKLENVIEDCDKDIEELEKLLERKRKERNVLVLEKEAHERSIEQARMKYSDKIEQIRVKQTESTSQLTLLEEQ